MAESCYRIEHYKHNDTPIMTYVPSAYVLTMEGSTRWHSTIHTLSTICKDTYVQYNKGFKKCTKADCVNNTARDIIDAYRNLFLHIQTQSAPVLVFEDDAFMRVDFRGDLEEIDQFLRTHRANIYSLGSIAFTHPTFNKHRPVFDWSALNMAHAMIWSFSARAQLLRMEEPCRMLHIDRCFTSKISHKYVYYRPVAYQIFPETPNSDTWCILCNQSPLDKASSPFLKQCLKGLGLDKKPEPGWSIIYAFYHSLGFISPILVVCILLLLMFSIRKTH